MRSDVLGGVGWGMMLASPSLLPNMPRPVPIPGLARRLAQAREARGFTQRTAARLLGCDHTWIGQLERGERQIDVPWLARLAGLYLVSTDWLIGGDPPGKG